jgi:hypothetical protein
MNDVLSYSPIYRKKTIEGQPIRWHSKHRVGCAVYPGDSIVPRQPRRMLPTRPCLSERSPIRGTFNAVIWAT